MEFLGFLDFLDILGFDLTLLDVSYICEQYTSTYKFFVNFLNILDLVLKLS